MKKLAIIGSGDLGQQIAYHAEHDGHYQIAGFFDDFLKKGESRHGYPILGGVKDVENVFSKNDFDVLMIGIGYNHIKARAALFDRFVGAVPFGTVVHSSSYVDASCAVGAGAFVYPRCVVDMNVRIENNVILNVGTVIAHDSVIGKHSILAPGVKVAGFVQIGASAILGIGSVIIDNLEIAPGSRTGAGAVVVKNIDQPGLYLGVPAKFIREL